MNNQTNKMPQLLTILQQLSAAGAAGSGSYVQIAEVKTAEPDDVSLVLTGTNLALDLDLFEVPVSLYPLRAGDRFLALPIVSAESGRWSLLVKINGGQALATMQSATSLKIDGMAGTYGADRLLLPAAVLNTESGGGVYRSLKAGDRVSLMPYLEGDTIKYAVTNTF